MGLFSALGGIVGNLIAPGIGGAIGGALGGAVEGSSQERAASQAAAGTAAATNEATRLQREMWQAQQEQQKPWLEAGQNALARMRGGEFALPEAFTGKVDLTQDPGYAFRLAEGQKALERSAAARGGLLSGATGKALTRYGQQMGSQEYQNAYSRALDAYNAATQRSTTGYNRLASMANIGQTSASQLGTAGQQYGQNISNALLDQAGIAGTAGIAGAQARESMYGNIGRAIGQVSPGQWSSMGSSIRNYLNPTYSSGYGLAGVTSENADIAI